MAKFRNYDYAQTMLVAVSLEEQLVPGTVEHTIHYVVEERLDLSGFDQERRNDETGRPGYDSHGTQPFRHSSDRSSCSNSS